MAPCDVGALRMTHDPASTLPARELLPRELHDFVVQLAIAVHKRAIYPPSHPLLHGAIDALFARLDHLLSARPSLSIGVADKRLVVEGIASDDEHPLLRELAAQIHLHQLGAVRFSAGLTRDELSSFVDDISASLLRGGEPLGAQPREALNRWTGIHLYPMAFDRLHLLDPGESDSAAGAIEHSSVLWIALARAALAGDWSDGAAEDPRLVAASIDTHEGDAGYDQVVIGCLVQLVDEMRAPERANPAVQRNVSEMLSNLSDRGLSRLLSIGGTSGTAQRHRFLADANETLAAGAVLDLVRVASTDQAAPISHAMLRLLGKLAQGSEVSTARSPEADRMLRLSVRRLLQGWTLDNPNPEGYEQVLEHSTRLRTGEITDRNRDATEPERMIDLALETQVIGLGTDAALARLAMRDGIVAVLERLQGYAASDVREGLIDRLINESLVREQLALERPDNALLQHAADRLRGRMVAPLVRALERRPDSDAGWISALLARIGWDGLEALGSELETTSPRVTRFLVAVFDHLDAWPPRIDPGTFARHEDAGVRRETLKFLLRSDVTREGAILLALRDADIRILNLGLTYTLRACSVECARLLMRRFEDPLLTSELRVRAVRAAGLARSPEVLPWLFSIATKPGWLSRERQLRKPVPEVVAAVAVIATHFSGTSEGTEVIALAHASRSDEFRRAASLRPPPSEAA